MATQALSQTMPQPITRPNAAPRPAPRPERGQDADPELAALTARARKGDTAALGALYDRYSPAIYAYLYRRTGNAELARDLTADVFVKVIEAIQGHRVWRESFTGWLYRIAHNLLVDHVRAVKRRPQSELPDTLPGTEGADLEDRVEAVVAATEVRAALDGLRPEYAQLLALRFAGDLTHAEMGKILGKTADNIKVTQYRALKALRKQLDRRAEQRLAPQPA
jgi:RNA polymerase sigma-70 factor (ECF subfamily)